MLAAQVLRAVSLVAVFATLPILGANRPSLEGVNALRDGVAITDFDGDSSPDVAVSHVPALRSSPGVSTYILQIQLSGRSGATALPGLKVDAPAGGLDLWSADIDADHDADIILTARASGVRVGVLVNDGAGGFDGQICNASGWRAGARLRAFVCGCRGDGVAAAVTDDALVIAWRPGVVPGSVEFLRTALRASVPVTVAACARGRSPPFQQV